MAKTIKRSIILAVAIMVLPAGFSWVTLCSASNNSIGVQWSAQVGTTYCDVGYGVAVDSSNNNYVVGFTSSSGANHDTDIAVYKLSNTGTQIWNKSFDAGTHGNDYGYSVAVDTSGNIYIAGSTDGSFTVDGFANAGGKDAFVMCLAPTGAKLWASQFGTGNNDEAFGIAVSSAHIFVTGYTEGNLNGKINAGGKDIFLIEMDFIGNILSTTLVGSNGDDVGKGIALDSSEDVYVVGYSSGSLGGIINSGLTDAFVLKYSGTNLLWTRLIGSSAYDYANAVAVSTEGVYIAGSTGGAFDGNASLGGTDAFLVKYSLDGVKSWSTQFGTDGNDNGYAIALTTDSVFAAGSTTGGFIGAVNAGSNDIFISRYTKNGAYVVSRQMGTASSDAIYGAETDHNGSIIAVGSTAGSFNGLNIGDQDILVVKFSNYSVPLLEWTNETNYTSGGVYPMDWAANATYNYHVKYVSEDSIAPESGYPKLHVLNNASEMPASPYTMSQLVAGSTNYSIGEIFFVSIVNLPQGKLSYYFEAYDASLDKAIGYPTLVTDGPVDYPTVVENEKITHGVFKPEESEFCTFSFTLSKAGTIGVKVYDSLGHEVRNIFSGALPAGNNALNWDGKDSKGSTVSSGVYVIFVNPGGNKQKKVVVIR